MKRSLIIGLIVLVGGLGLWMGMRPASEAPVTAQAPSVEPVIEAPAPVEEPPVAETPAQETPAAETPAVDAPAVEAPAEVAPAAEPPAVEAPAPEAQTPGAVDAAAAEMPADMDAASLRALIEAADALTPMQRNSLILLLESAGDNRALLQEVYRSASELLGN